MKRTRMITALAAAVVLLPASSWAFSFGSFAPGEKIVSIQLAAGSSPTVSFDGTTNTMVFDASVSTITTNLGVYSIPLGDVVFSSTVTIVSGTEQVIPPFSPVLITAGFANGLAADLSITDVGPGGSGVLLEADYVGVLEFTASSLPVVGSLDGTFTVTGGDAAFQAAFGSSGQYFANLGNFLLSGGMPAVTLCDLVEGGCPAGTTIASFTANPSATIVPIPEPGVAALLILGLAGVARRQTTVRLR